MTKIIINNTNIPSITNPKGDPDNTSSSFWQKVMLTSLPLLLGAIGWFYVEYFHKSKDTETECSLKKRLITSEKSIDETCKNLSD